ncbi:conserved hypothetical protein [Coccidioides posadasii str. Silveira]|uniref:Uncharacterized protein n=1 Tax=Coccidioides posadasii (strain RMSCC 757 / Silveira) TaxID=443226 RepID=E9CUQ8_COCPS|nr:conserved hypothetical protein [Coccidioides posadasii str. Silveira]
MTKDQETKKLESESTMAEGTTELYATMSQGENKRIVVHSHIPMPSPGTANAPWFDSRDATLFIERFYQMCKDYRVIDPKNIIEWLARYCVTWIGEWMKTLEDYKEGNWEVFSKEIIHEFCDQDITYKIHCQDYLQTITKKPHAWDGNIHTYELPEKLQNKIIDKAKLNLSDDMSPIDFRKVVWVTMDLIDQYEGNKKVFEEDEIKQKKMEKLGEQYQLANKPPTVEAPKKTASFVKTEEFKLKAKAKGSDSTNIEAAIEKMINEFTNLALAIRVQSNQIQGNSDQYYMLQREGSLKPIPNYPTNCYEYQSDMSNEYCHIDDKENLHMSSKNQNYQAITSKSGIPNMYIVQSMEENEWAILKLTSPKKKINQQEETPPANSTSVKI